MDQKKIWKFSNMFEDRRLKIDYLHWNHLSFNRLLFAAIIITTAVCGNRAESLGTDDGGCSAHTTCTTCTANDTVCDWNVAEQTCGGTTGAAGELIVADQSSCPKFTVEYGGRNSMLVKVTITESRGTLIGLLRNSSVMCRLNDYYYDVTVVGDQIVCSSVGLASNPRYPNAWYLSISFDGKPLRFDNVSDHYVTDYRDAEDNDCRPLGPKCAESYWDDRHSGTRNYCAWCPGYHPCSRLRGHRHCNSLQLSNCLHVITPAAVEIRDGNPAAWIEWLSPANGSSLHGDAITVRIAVHNHALIAASSKSGPTVVVDGRQCDVDEAHNNGSIACTLPRTGDEFDVAQLDRALVKVTYPGLPNVIVQLNRSAESEQPGLQAGQTFEGISSGGTTFYVWGVKFTSLLKPLFRVIYAKRQYDGSCRVLNDTCMECEAPAIDDANMTVRDLPFKILEHANAQPKVQAPKFMHYRVHPDPDFVDFTVDGCCNVTVHALDLKHLGDHAAEYLSVRLAGNNNVKQLCNVAAVKAKQIECWLPHLVASASWPQQIAVTVGGLKANVTRRKKEESSSLRTENILPGILTITAYVSFIAFLIAVLVVLRTSSNAYDLLFLHHHRQHQSAEIAKEENISNFSVDVQTETAANVDDIL